MDLLNCFNNVLVRPCLFAYSLTGRIMNTKRWFMSPWDIVLQAIYKHLLARFPYLLSIMSHTCPIGDELED